MEIKRTVLARSILVSLTQSSIFESQLSRRSLPSSSTAKYFLRSIRYSPSRSELSSFHYCIRGTTKLMERDSRESEADDHIEFNQRSMDLTAWEGEDLSHDFQRLAQTRAFDASPEALSITPTLNTREPQYALLEDGPNANCDPAELSTFGLGPQLAAPSATTVFTQHQPVTPDDDFTFLFDIEGSSSDLAQFAATAMPSNATEDTIMDPPDSVLMLPTTLTAESTYSAAAPRDHCDPIMDECRNLLDDVPGFSTRSHRNVPPHMVQYSSYPNHPTMMPVQTTESEISTLAVSEHSVTDVSHNTLHPTSIRLASQPIAPSHSIEIRPTQSLRNVQFPRRGYAPIVPKEPIPSDSTTTLSIRNAQDIYSSSEFALVPYGNALATKGAQKRLRSPGLNDDFPFIRCRYDSGKNAIMEPAIPSERLSNKKVKRARNRKSCLQCQFLQKKVMYSLSQNSGAQTDIRLVLRNLSLRTLSGLCQYQL